MRSAGRALVHPLSTFRVNSGLPSAAGATRRLTTPKPSAAVSRLSKLAEKLPRSVFRLRRASRPNMDFAPAGRGGQSAAPCGHFASLVRSTFGLRGFPPLRFGASRWRCRCQSAANLSVRLRFAFLNARLRTIQRICFAFAKRGGLCPRWWWARGGDAEAIVRFCTRLDVPLLPRRGSFAVAGRAPCQQRTCQEILYIWISQISNLKSHFGQRATDAGRTGGLLREARPRPRPRAGPCGRLKPLPSATRISPRFSGSVEGRLRSACVDSVAALPDTAGT